jgi:flagellum-specific peptidoglycan hydrolase FlgJ
MAASITAGSGIFPQTLLAMAIVESSGLVNGKSYVGVGSTAKLANNYFGIKASPAWKGATIKLNTPNDATKVSTFRKYASVKDSFADYVRFLKQNKRYNNASVFDAENYAEQIIRIAKAGYAESPNYAAIVSNVADRVNSLMDKLAVLIKPINKGGAAAAILLLSFFFYLYKQSK